MRRWIAVLCVVFLFIGDVVVQAKQSDLVGAWYSDSPGVLRAEIQGYLDDASVGTVEGDIIGAVAPHAGLRFSGPIAAFTYKAIKVKGPALAVVVGFTHRRYFPGRIAVFTDRYYSTPLGKAMIDMDTTEKLFGQSERIESIPEAFASENSVEMQIPFIQTVLPDAKLVLIAICDQREENWRILADALYNVLKGRDDFVIIASTDMSHYLTYRAANEKDGRTAGYVEKMDPSELYKRSLEEDRPDGLMCGYGAVCAVMLASGKLGADKAVILDSRNSGDTSGMKDRVVGYMSALFLKTPGTGKKNMGQASDSKEDGRMFNDEQKKEILNLARNSIKYYLETGNRMKVDGKDEALKQELGAFVTLHKGGQLRGCIGHILASGPLDTTVRDMAVAAAVEDPRFPPVTLKELDNIDIEISVLSPLKKVEDPGGIEMGKHGVIVRMGWKNGVYLPQVADETGWNREEFMDSLCAQKAGIPRDAWKTGACDIFTFTAEVFGEKEME